MAFTDNVDRRISKAEASVDVRVQPTRKLTRSKMVQTRWQNCHKIFVSLGFESSFNGFNRFFEAG